MLTLVSLPDLDPMPESALIPIPINLEHKAPILDSHIPLMKNECEFQLFDLDPTFEQNLILESKLDLNHILESALVPIPFIFEPKSIISPNHIPLLDHNDSEMIF